MAAESSVSSGRVLVTEFIEKYKNSECLWKVTHAHYKSKLHRQKALEELLSILKKIDGNANIDTVSKKINSMRSAFNKEHNKVKAANRSGMSAEDEYLPKLWYYDLLLFLNERETEVGNSCDINAILNGENDENRDQDMNTDQASPLSTRSEPPLRRLDINNLKRKEKSGVCEVLNKISKRLDSSTTKIKPTFSAFGEHVAEKLRTMNSDAAKFCQKIINDAIFYAEFNNLNYTSRIVTDHIHVGESRSPYLERASRSPSTQTSSPYYRSLRSPSAQPQSPYQSPNEQSDRSFQPSSTLTQSLYQTPNEQSDRPFQPPPTQTPAPYLSPNEQSDRPFQPLSTQSQSPCQSQNEQINRSYRPPSTQTQSSYQSHKQPINRPYRPPPFTQTQSSYQSHNQPINKPYRPPPSTQTQSPYQSPNQQLNRPYRLPSTQTTLPYKSSHEQLDRTSRSPATQTEFSQSILIELPYQPPEQPLQKSSASNAIIVDNYNATQTQSLYQSQNEQLDESSQSPATQTELAQPILIELPYQLPEQPLQQSSASNTIIVNTDEIVDCEIITQYHHQLSQDTDFSSF